MKIVAIGAHPDDIEYSCLGTLLKIKERYSAQIYYIVLSNGAASYDIEEGQRNKEQQIAFSMSKFDDIIIADFNDGYINCNIELIKYLDTVLSEITPDIIITHSPNDTHQDHRAVSKAVISASRFTKKIFFFRSYSAQCFNPTVYISIDDYIKQKKSILSIFQSQVQKNLKNGIDFVESAIALNHFYGTRSFCEYAEGFEVYRYID